MCLMERAGAQASMIYVHQDVPDMLLVLPGTAEREPR